MYTHIIKNNEDTTHFKQWSNKKYAVFNSLKKQIKICALIVTYSILTQSNETKAQYDTTRISKVIELDEVEVVATLLNQEALEAGRSITIISSNDIYSAPANSLDEIIRYSPCIEVQSRNLFGVQSDFSIRGGTFNQTLILIDGMRFNDPLTGHYSANIPLPFSEIDRIEIIRGPAASIYGPDAVGGVINIITKTFTPNADQQHLFSTGSILYGENNYQGYNAGVYLKENQLILSGGFMTNTSDGEKLPSGIHNFFDIKNATLSAAYQFTPQWYAAIRTAYEVNDFNSKNFYTELVSDTSQEKVIRSWNQIKINRTGAKSSTTFSGVFSQSIDSFSFFPGYPPNAHKTRYYNTFIHHSFELSSRIKLALGTQTDFRSIKSNDRGNHSDWHTGTFVNTVYKPWKSLSLSFGIRGDYDENFGFEIIPQVNASYSLNTIILRGSSGRSIRAADYTERYVSNNIDSLLGGRNLGNPELLAESSWQHDLGWDYYPYKHIKISVTGYYRHSKNMIDYVKTNESNIPNNQNLLPGQEYYYAQNIKTLSTTGLEIELYLKKEFKNSSYLSFTGGYALLHSANTDTLLSKYIPSQAKHLLSGTILYSHKRFNISLHSTLKERETMFLESLNVKHDRIINVWNSRLDINLYRDILYANIQAKNILDRTYYEVFGAKMPGRWIMAGIVWKYRKEF